MIAAVYARRSSENQRPESIDDQVSACRRLAKERGLVIADDHIYADQAQSAHRSDRPGLTALLAAAPSKEFDVVLVDDLSRLARDNHLMLSIIADVIRGHPRDFGRRWPRQQRRGVHSGHPGPVGSSMSCSSAIFKEDASRADGPERGGLLRRRETFGYRSVPFGEIRMDKKGRPRPDGYKMEIEPKEAAIILRIFTSYADGLPFQDRQDAERGERPPARSARQRAGRRRRSAASSTTRSTPGGGSETRPRATRSPHGTTASLREARVRVGGPRGRGAAHRPDRAVGGRQKAAQGDAPHLARREREAQVLGRTRQPAGALPDASARRRDGKALVETERRVENLTDEVDALRRSREKIFQAPPVEWIKDRLRTSRRSSRTAPLARRRRSVISSDRSASSSSRRKSDARSIGRSPPSMPWP